MFFGIVLCLLACGLQAGNPLTGLVERILPGYEDQFEFAIVDTASEEDFFELASSDGIVRIAGNNPVSVAAGLNWYLKYYCHASLSFCEDQLDLPKQLPEVKSKVRMSTPLTRNFYMNYCTFSYTTAFWDWERWEREIDLMALNGINTPMAMVGAEAVWRNTLRKFGYTDKEIKEYLCGPSYFGWFLMGNLEGHGGPLPDEWFDRQIALQQRILKRMREWGMQPVFQAFYGMVPHSLKQKFPNADIAMQGNWCGFRRPPVLLPTDPLFGQMAQVWYEEYERLFGKTDYFAGDLFHEGGNTEGLNIGRIAHGVQAAMLDYNPRAQWFIQSWGENPREALLNGLDRKHTVIVDLCAEFWTKWKERQGFNGFPWIWSHVTNYGGNIGLHGRLDAIARGSLEARADAAASPSLTGTGAVPEGIGVNPVVFDLANEMRWRNESVNMEQWIENYAQRRYGSAQKELAEAWHIFYQTAYGTFEGHRRPSESVFCALPSLKGERITASAWSQCKIFYNPDLYAQGVDLFLKAADELSQRPTYRYDVVDFVRQYLADQGRDAYLRLTDAYKQKDKTVFEQQKARFLEVMQDQDRLLSAHPAFNVGHWLDEARAASANESVQDLYEMNARQLIGTWSDRNTELRDYAHREWGGMLRDYYYPRWKNYLDYLSGCLQGNEPKAPDSFPAEREWIMSHQHYKPSGEDVVELAKDLFYKHYRK